ncbi:MAG: ligand-binding sensor domain-containing protein, partial [Mucilaginibacter sp.]
MHTKFYFLLVVALFFTCINAFGQSSQYRFSQLDISNGLSHNQVTCIFKDSEGFMWFGTASGLNRYDGYSFKIFKHDADNKNSVLNDFIKNIYEGPDKKLWILTSIGYCFYDAETERFNSDTSSLLKSLKIPGRSAVSKIIKGRSGDYWFLCADSGVYRYNAISRRTKRYHDGIISKPSLYSNKIIDIAEDAGANIWLVYNDATVEMLDTKQDKITYRTGAFNKTNYNGKVRHYALTVDRDNDLWLYTTNLDEGVYYYSPSSGIFRHIYKESPQTKLNSNVISYIVQADDGLVWIGTDHGGINVLDKKGFKITYLLNREDDAKSLRENNTMMLYKDNLGIMWVGTFKKGVSYYHKNIIRLPLYRHFASDPASLNFEDVDKFVEDKRGNIWIGTNGGGLIYFNRQTGKFTRYKYDPGNPNGISSDIIISLFIDHNQKLWIGTYFGGLDC